MMTPLEAAQALEVTIRSMEKFPDVVRALLAVAERNTEFWSSPAAKGIREAADNLPLILEMTLLRQRAIIAEMLRK